MFIVQTKDGRTFVEGKEGIVWDKIPEDIEISSLSLTLPFKIKFQTRSGEATLNPKFIIKDYDEYYFSNEETISVLAVNGVMGRGNRTLSAKIVAGIKNGIVTEFRMDKNGNIGNKIISKEELEKSGFRMSTIRKGLTT